MPYKSKEDRDAQQERHRQANKERLWTLLCNSSCKDCLINDPRVLEFDHLPSFVKNFDISRAVAGSTRSWTLIQKEIDKCDVVCSNCHKIRTAERGSFSRFKMFTLMSG